MRCMVEVMMGSSLGFGAWDECGGGESGRANSLCEDKPLDQLLDKLLDLRAARLVVATADAFEHALCKVKEIGRYCVVSR